MTEKISTQNTKIEDLELKLETTNNYLVELLNNLKRGLQDTFLSISNDMTDLNLWTTSAHWKLSTL